MANSAVAAYKEWIAVTNPKPLGGLMRRTVLAVTFAVCLMQACADDVSKEPPLLFRDDFEKGADRW